MAQVVIMMGSKSDEEKAFSFAKENGPFGTPRERLRLAVSGLNDFYASGMKMIARGVAAFEVAIRFAAAPIIRCRSAQLVEVRTNFRPPSASILQRVPARPPRQTKQ